MLKNLHLTVTVTVRLTGSPTPLVAVQRYVDPFELLEMLLMRNVPSTTGCRGTLSVPLTVTVVQVMFGVGLPVALQLRVTMESSQTTWSLLTEVSSGSTRTHFTHTHKKIE